MDAAGSSSFVSNEAIEDVLHVSFAGSVTYDITCMFIDVFVMLFVFSPIYVPCRTYVSFFAVLFQWQVCPLPMNEYWNNMLCFTVRLWFSIRISHILCILDSLQMSVIIEYANLCYVVIVTAENSKNNELFTLGVDAVHLDCCETTIQSRTSTGAYQRKLWQP